jgi:predicted enzyme related to lactoylglutathione lyase
VRMSFAAFMPRRRWLAGHLVLARELASPRFSQVEVLSPRNVVHSFRLSSPAEVDAEFTSWLAEAYQVGAQQHLGVIGWIREIVLDTADPHRLAAFWAALLGGTPVQWYPGWVTLEPPPHGQRLSFQGTGAAPQAGSGVHFDILVSDLDRAQQRVVALGGSFVAEHVSPRPGPGGQPVSWRVCRDPDGHVFCLVTRLSDLSVVP